MMRVKGYSSGRRVTAGNRPMVKLESNSLSPKDKVTHIREEKGLRRPYTLLPGSWNLHVASVSRRRCSTEENCPVTKTQKRLSFWEQRANTWLQTEGSSGEAVVIFYSIWYLLSARGSKVHVWWILVWLSLMYLLHVKLQVSYLYNGTNNSHFIGFIGLC